MKSFTYILLLLLLTISCSNRSRVANFEYLGFGDTILAVIEGEVYENKYLSSKPLKDVDISVENINKSTTTDEDGQFQIGLDQGNYKIKVSKKGYQTIYIENYVSIPDEISKLKIILVKGSRNQTFFCPNRK